MVRQFHSVPRDAGGHAPDGTIWTGEVQAIDYTDSSTAATLITVPGRWYRFWATTSCHINIGTIRIAPATAKGQDTCYPISDGDTGGWSEPVYVPDNFDSLGDGTGSLYIRIIRNASNGTLYISQAFPDESSRTFGVTSTSTTTTTTTTTTSTTTTTTTTTSTTTTTTTTTTTSTTTTTTTSTTT